MSADATPAPTADAATLPLVLTRTEAAELARVSVDTIDRWRVDGSFPSRRHGRAVRIPRDPFLAWLGGAA